MTEPIGEHVLVQAVRQIELQNRIDHFVMLTKKLMKYTAHKPGCNSLIKERDSAGRYCRYACNCGLDEVKNMLTKAGKK